MQAISMNGDDEDQVLPGLKACFPEECGKFIIINGQVVPNTDGQCQKKNLSMPGTQCKTNVYVAGGLCPGMGPKIFVGVSCQNASLLNAELKLSMIWSTPKKVNVTAKNRTTWYADKVKTYAK